jgi:hypothetical protein
MDNAVATTVHFRPVISGEAQSADLMFTRPSQGLQYIGGLAAGADPQGDIAAPGQGLKLLQEYIVKMKVVADSGKYRCIDRQGYSRQRGPFNLKAVYEFGGNVLGIRSASSIAEEKQALSFLEGACDSLRHLENQSRTGCLDLLLHPDAFAEDLIDGS